MAYCIDMYVNRHVLLVLQITNSTKAALQSNLVVSVPQVLKMKISSFHFPAPFCNVNGRECHTWITVWAAEL